MRAAIQTASSEQRVRDVEIGVWGQTLQKYDCAKAPKAEVVVATHRPIGITGIGWRLATACWILVLSKQELMACTSKGIACRYESSINSKGGENEMDRIRCLFKKVGARWGVWPDRKSGSSSSCCSAIFEISWLAAFAYRLSTFSQTFIQWKSSIILKIEAKYSGSKISLVEHL